MNRQDIYDTLNPCIDNQASMVRMFNLVPGISIDIYINDSPRVVGLEYGELSDYMPTIIGKRNLKVYQSQTDNLLLELQDFDIPPGQILTYVFFGSPSNVRMLPLLDDINETIAPDRTKVRFYNLDASDAALTITSSIGSTSISLASGNGNNYTQINPGIALNNLSIEAY